MISDNSVTYISADLSFLDIADGEYYVWNADRCESRIISAAQAEILTAWRQPSTFYEMVELLTSRGWTIEDSEALLHEFVGLLRHGLIKDIENICARFFSTDVGNGEKEEVSQIPLAWVSADRPQTLSHSISSFISNLDRHGKETKLFVFENSRESHMSAEYQRTLNKLREKHGVNILYAGKMEKQRFLHELKMRIRRDKVPERLIDFALESEEWPYTLGVQRNTAMLAFAGEPFILHDDDVYCNLARSEQYGHSHTHTLQISSDPSTYFTRRFKSIDELKTGLRIEDHDYLSLFTAVGRCLKTYLRRNFDSCDLSGADPSLSATLERGLGRIVVETLGFYGDSAKTENHYALSLREEEGRSELFADEASYLSYLCTRNVYREIAQELLRKNSPFFGTVLALDNEAPLPPFFPLFRNTDSIFSATLSLCRPHTFRAYHPWMVEQRPQSSRSFNREQTRRIYPRFSDLLLLLHVEFQRKGSYQVSNCTGEDLSMIYRQDFGTFLRSVGSLSEKSFIEYEYHLWRVFLSRQMYHLSSLLERYDFSPTYWAEDVQALVQHAELLLTDGRLPVPAELSHVEPPEEAMKLFKTMLSDFGTLIETWPSIWNTALELKREGLHFAREL